MAADDQSGRSVGGGMEVYYRREMRHNYLVIVPEEPECTGYETEMLAGNHIDGLLKFRISRPEGQICYYYEITSKQPLSRILDSRGIRIQELRSLFLGIAGVLSQLEAYLLPEEQLLLEPDYIYIEPDTFRAYLCLVPCSARVFPAAVERLLQYLLGCVDHQDKECVVLAYGLYQECQKDNFGIDDLLYLVRGSTGMAAAMPEMEANDSVHETPIEYAAALQPAMKFNPDRLTAKKEKTIISDRQTTKKEKAVYKEKNTQPEKRLINESISQPGEDNHSQKNGWIMRLGDAVNRISGKNPETKEESGWESWQEIFEEPETDIEEKEPEHEPITVLLADLDKQEERYCLKALQPGLTDITIDSFPFVIGKNSSLADYQLDRETVSRLHAKIDRSGNEFQITDLNSTNGTKVRGRLLENNECGKLQLGDEVHIAEWRYQFQRL